MPTEVILPKVDMDMSHGTLAVWHVAPGETVAKGAPLFDIETDKAAMEVEAPASGRLEAVTAKPGDKIAVGTVVGLIFAEGESVVPAAPTVVAPTSGPRPAEVILPKVDMDMSHGTLAVWHVAEGELVAKGAALFDIETDKAAMEVEAPADGRLYHILAKPGDKVPVGSVIAYIYPEGMSVSAAPQFQSAVADAPDVLDAPKAAVAEPAVVLAEVQAVPAVVGESKALRATPAARAAARLQQLDLATVSGTGPRGRIQRDDVLEQSSVLPEKSGMGSKSAVWTAQAGSLHVSVRQGTGIPLVMLHGFTADSQSWAPLEKALGVERTLIRIDLPGHGRSPRRKIDSFAALARMVVEAFDEATKEHDRIHLLGHSLGGALALSVADIRARRVASLSLIAPAGFGPEIDAAALTGITRATRAESLGPWLRRLTARPEGISEDYIKAAMRLRADPSLRGVQADMADVLFPDGVQPFDLRPAVARLTCPTAVVWGKQDHILPFRQALSIDGDFALHLLSGAGHVPQIECPVRLALILARHMSAGQVVKEL